MRGLRGHIGAGRTCNVRSCEYYVNGLLLSRSARATKSQPQRHLRGRVWPLVARNSTKYGA
eukprot:10966054-Alexandrium_andersonii.AAC.1